MISMKDFVKNEWGDFLYESPIIRFELNDKQYTKSNMEYIDAINKYYSTKITEIAEAFASDPFFSKTFPDVSVKDISEKLGKPIIRTFKGKSGKSGTITYTDHSFDNVHILDIDFDNVLENFRNISIDG